MKIISTGAAEILMVDLPEDATLCVINGLHDCIKYSFNGAPHFIDLPEGYNYTILGRAKELTEEQWQSILPNYGGKLFDYDPKHYLSFPDYAFANHPFESRFFDTATESGHSLLKEQGVLLVNPHEHPIYKGTMGDELFMQLASEHEEAQSKVKNPLIIKAEKI